jgi:hypothetical protein
MFRANFFRVVSTNPSRFFLLLLLFFSLSVFFMREAGRSSARAALITTQDPRAETERGLESNSCRNHELHSSTAPPPRCAEAASARGRRREKSAFLMQRCRHEIASWGDYRRG